MKLLHATLPEWKDPGESSAPIRPEAILESEGKDRQEIESVAAKALEDRFFVALERA